MPDPYPTYRALRENEPVKRLRNGSWFLTRYDDLVTAYKSTRQFSSDKKKEFFPKYGDTLLYEHHTTSLVFNDPARAHQGAAADHGRAVAARDRRDGAGPDRAGRTGCSIALARPRARST